MNDVGTVVKKYLCTAYTNKDILRYDLMVIYLRLLPCKEDYHIVDRAKRLPSNLNDKVYYFFFIILMSVLFYSLIKLI